ncbi:Cell division protein FtsA [Buchnera aphidicola (Tetraneura ulmi)]|uniref:cell division protein FtsA n=1 Tax=Buchnera aphidicola TaxID=9 RepID=UPI003463D243
MISTTKKKLVFGIDIGTTKVTTLVGEILTDGLINIIGIGNCSSKGIKNGSVNDLESIIKCIKKSIQQAEIMSKCRISSVHLSLSSKDINCQNEIGIVPINQGKVNEEDIKNVIFIAKSVQIYNEHYILHVLPQEYQIDQQTGIKNPTGLSGIRMKAEVHLITCHKKIEQNLIKYIEKFGLKVNQLIFSGLASSEAVLTEEEKNLGVCLIDIGGGTMDIIIYIAGILKHSQVIPYAGNTITNDIAYAFSTSQINAENIKTLYGKAINSNKKNKEKILTTDIAGTQNKKIKKDKLIEIIEPRCSELFELVNQEIISLQRKLKKNGSKYQLLSGIVLTGGGSKMKNVSKCAEKIFNKKVRIGFPKKITGITKNINDPNYSTAIGLLHFGKKIYMEKLKKNKHLKKKNIFSVYFKKINNWIKNKF